MSDLSNHYLRRQDLNPVVRRVGALEKADVLKRVLRLEHAMKLLKQSLDGHSRERVNFALLQAKNLILTAPSLAAALEAVEQLREREGVS